MIDALREWVADTSGLKTVWQHQDAPRPDRAFISMYITALNDFGHDERRWVDTGGATDHQHTIGQRSVNVSIQCHESSKAKPFAALERMRLLQNQLRLESSQVELLQSGLALIGQQTLIQVPQLRGTDWEPQATLDVEIGLTDVTTEDAYWIKTVTGTDTVTGGVQTEIKHEFTVEV